MPENGDFTCKYCGKEFDSKRGLHVHQGQVHPDEEKQEVQEPETQESEETEKAEESEPSESETEDSFGDSEELDLDKTEEDFAVNPGKESSAINISLTTRQVAAASFAVGLLLGGILAGAYFMTDTTPNPYSRDAVNISDVNTEGEPVMGQQDAPVTLVMYEDFQCPFCRLHSQRTQPKIVSNYVNSGDVKLVWKDFPIPQLGHNWAEPAAAAMECVYREDNDAFWKVQKDVFDNQKSITESEVQSQVISYAEEEGVNGTKVRNCIESGSPMEEVVGDKKEGASYNATVGGTRFVSGTPSFVIYGSETEKGTAISGAVPYDLFDRLIQDELKN